MPRGKCRGWQCLGRSVPCIACFVQKLRKCAILCGLPKEDTAAPPGEAGGRGWRPGQATSGTAGLPVSTSMSKSRRTPRLALSTSSRVREDATPTSSRVQRHVQRRPRPAQRGDTSRRGVITGPGHSCRRACQARPVGCRHLWPLAVTPKRSRAKPATPPASECRKPTEATAEPADKTNKGKPDS
jgi:hypothetical protein